MTKYRHIITLFLVLAVLFLPYWVYAPAIILGIVLLPLYWEAVILGFVIDVLYGAHGSFRTALAALIMVAVFVPVRERLRFTSH